MQSLRVKDLWLPPEKSWNEELIRAILRPAATGSILTTPLNPLIDSDRYIWALTPSGSFSVKSAYHHILNELTDNIHLHVFGNWSLISHLQVPPTSRCSFGVHVGTASHRMTNFKREGSHAPWSVPYAPSRYRTYGISSSIALLV